MKNLILCTIAFLFLFTSCFEKEEVVVVPEEPIEEGNVMECEFTIKFIESILTHPSLNRPELDRASIKKYTYKNKVVYYLDPTGNYWTDDAGIVIDGNCNVICKNSQVYEERDCLDWNTTTVKYIETIWTDPR